MSDLVEALRQGFSEIPPVAIAIVLLAGPTVALIGYRLISASRRLQSSDEVEAAPFWVCQDCRSVNELRHSRCYHCHLDRDRQPDLEVIVEQPVRAPGFFEAPAGSPFAALGQAVSTVEPPPVVPVMGHQATDPVAVGPGRPADRGVAAPALESATEGPADELAQAAPRQA